MLTIPGLLARYGRVSCPVPGGMDGETAGLSERRASDAGESIHGPR
jgi:hypothetical protein